MNAQSLVAAVKEGIRDAVADALAAALSDGLKLPLGNGLGDLDALLSERLGSRILVQAAVDPSRPRFWRVNLRQPQPPR